MGPMRVILASKSPARLELLRRAGVHVEVLVSGIDESQVTGLSPIDHTLELATLKAEAVASRLSPSTPTIIIGCDSMLELEGRVYGKPGSPEAAIARWYRMRGRQGILHTGHHVIVLDGAHRRTSTRVASTTVNFADLSDAEIAAYAATGEPQRVAGAFTIDGYGGAFITSIHGDPHNVVGLSLPLLRQMLLDLGIGWHKLWTVQHQAAFPNAERF